jgi:hypothetical protein
MNEGCTKTPFGLRIAASPPDVRQGSALPESLSKKVWGCAPGSASGLKKYQGKARTKGRAQMNRLELTGAAEPRLTSGGEAGTCNDKRLFVQS